MAGPGAEASTTSGSSRNRQLASKPGTRVFLVSKISGEIERSKPPPMIDGALAIAAIASGATLASWSVRPKPPCSVAMLAASIPTVRRAAKPKL